MNAKVSPSRSGARAVPKEPDAQERAMLITLFSQGFYADAESLARDFVVRFPKDVLGWKVLGAVLKQTGRGAEAVAPMQRAVALAPRDHEAYNNLGVTHKDLGRFSSAVACYRQALALKPDFAAAWSNLGRAMREQGQLAEALKCYRQQLALTPDDVVAQHQVNALTGQTSERAPEQYVAGVFDHCAASFDEHLTQHLGYATPAALASAIQLHAQDLPAPWRVLDLGCGTGLMAEALGDQAGEMVGVDLSAGMLAQAQAKGCYQRLVQTDLLRMMRAEAPASFDLLTSADVFVYLGRLDQEVGAVKRVLKPGGLFAFSLESWLPAPGEEGPGYLLNRSGRYSHSEAYVRGLAVTHGFKMLTMEQATLREDDGQAIPGWLVLWRA